MDSNSKNLLVLGSDTLYQSGNPILFNLRKTPDFEINTNDKLKYISSENYLFIDLFFKYNFKNIDLPNIQCRLKIFMNDIEAHSCDYLNINRNIQINKFLIRLKPNDTISFKLITFNNVNLTLLQNSYILISRIVT